MVKYTDKSTANLNGLCFFYILKYDNFIIMNKFDSLPISRKMKSNLNRLGYIEITPIQELSIPSVISKKDVIAQAKTGSGKTAAFGIGLLDKLNVTLFRVQSLVLCPTRELADQISSELRKIAKFTHNIKILTLTGGIPLYKQEHSLNHQAHIIVGTPGRVLRLLQRGSLDLSNLKSLVIDEADRMLGMGFIDELDDIISFCPKNRQTLCYSATYPEDIEPFIESIMYNPIRLSIDVKHDEKSIEHIFYTAESTNVASAVMSVIKQSNFKRVIVFCNTKIECNSLSEVINSMGYTSLSLNGDLEQKDRTEVLIRFSNKSVNILIATDVAARGLDINGLDAVINVDLPFDSETYIHRVGRTGRAGSTGHAVTLLDKNSNYNLDQLNRDMNSSFDINDLKLLDSFGDVTEPEMVTVSINGGRKNKISAGDILGALTSSGDIRSTDVGSIDRLDYITFIAIKSSVVNKALSLLKNRGVKGKMFRVVLHK